MIGRFVPVMVAGAIAGLLWAADAVPSGMMDWKLAGPFGGTARSIVLDPQNPQIVLAGGMNSRLFRSEDGGQNWTLLDFPHHKLSEVASILVDPQDGKHYFAGMISAEEGGLFESHDAGATWKPVKAISHVGVRALTASASKPDEFVAGTLQGVWLSENSGKDWSRISDKDNLEMRGITVVAIDTKNPDIIYAGTSHLPWKTTDRGKTWQSIHTGMIDDSDVFSIYVNPSNPSEILASACSGIYQSGSRGDEWKKLMGIPNTSRRTHVIREDPANPSVIYAGTTTGLYKSLNAGATWKTMSNTQANSIAFDPAHPGGMFLALEYEGIGHSLNGGETITLSNQGFVDRTIAAVTHSGDKLFAIETQEGETSGIFSSTDKGQTWTEFRDVRGLGGVHLKALTGVPDQANMLLAASPHQMYKSLDGGNSWKPLPVRLIETPAPVTEKKAAAPARSARSRTAARARTARPVKPVVKTREVSPSEITAFYAMKDGSDTLIFAATDLGLLKSTDAGERWKLATVVGAPAFTALYFPAQPDGHMIARAAGGLFESKDYGEHWDELHFPTPVSDINEIAIPSGSSSTLLAATRVGLYRSTDGGATWAANPSGMPASTVNSVLFASGDATGYAAQYGRLYMTTDGGASWKEAPTEVPSLYIRQLWMPDLASSRLFAITADLGILFRDCVPIR